MILGLPTEIFVHEVLRLAALSSLAYVCVQRWHLGRWARLGAVAGGVGTLLYGYYLLSWVLLTQADIAARSSCVTPQSSARCSPGWT